MKILNDLPGFGAVFLVPIGERGNTEIEMGKVSIYGECLWLRCCRDLGTGLYTGIIANKPIFTKDHSLIFDQIVSFRIY